MSVYQVANLENIDLFVLGLTSAAILFLGVIVFLSNRRSITNLTFLLFSLVATFYAAVNYLSYQLTSPLLVLWTLRLVIFSALWYSFLLFHLFYVFPKDAIVLPRPYKFVLLPFVFIISILTLTPFVFSGIETLRPPEAPIAQHEVGIILFGIMSLYLVVGGAFILFKKVTRAKGLEKRRIELVLVGTLITYSFIIVFNLILPAAFKNTTFIPLAPVFTLPFILFTAYAIIKYRFLNVKVIATEVLTFVLAVAMLFEVLLAEDLGVLVFRVSIFLLVLSFGILLIRSVRREVEQREKLEVLTKQLKVANRELKRLDAAKSEFVSIASHQLRTPLTAIKGYISLVLEGTYGAIEKKLQRPLKNVYDSNQRLIRLVNDLLSLSRMESGKMELTIEETDLEKMIQSVLDELKIKAEQKNLKLVLKEPSQPLVPVFVDSEKIRNAILNLVDNSIRYTEKGNITVSTAQKNNKLLLTVQDTGAGMTKEELGKLFESFSRGRAGVKFSTEGAGLGLYIAKQFVQMHKGKIWAESPGRGQGSTFHIELPLR